MTSNRDMRMFERFVESIQEMNQRDLGAEAKEYRKEREALEKIVGIHDTLEKAKAILDQAEKEYDTIVSAGDLQATERLNESAAKIKASQAALGVKQQAASATRAELKIRFNDLDEREQALNDAEGEVLARETACVLRANDLARAETALAAREAAVGEREAAAQRFEAWRATAPRYK